MGTKTPSKVTVRNIGTCKRFDDGSGNDDTLSNTTPSGRANRLIESAYVNMTGNASKFETSTTDYYVHMNSPLSPTTQDRHLLSDYGYVSDHNQSHEDTDPVVVGKSPSKVLAESVIQGKAILRLSLYINSGMMTVHVIECRHLAPLVDLKSNAYIKVSLIPDVTNTTTCFTEVAPGTNHPRFNEKFSFELLPGDTKKRLHLSLWHQPEDHRKEHEILGSMSFGLRHVLSKQKRVDGWYYWLDGSVGSRKHVKAIARQSPGKGEHLDVSASSTFSTPDARRFRDHHKSFNIPSTTIGSERRDVVVPITWNYFRVNEIGRSNTNGNVGNHFGIEPKPMNNPSMGNVRTLRRGNSCHPDIPHKSNPLTKSDSRSTPRCPPHTDTSRNRSRMPPIPECRTDGDGDTSPDFTSTEVIGRVIRQCVSEVLLTSLNVINRPTGEQCCQERQRSNRTTQDDIIAKDVSEMTLLNNHTDMKGNSGSEQRLLQSDSGRYARNRIVHPSNICVDSTLNVEEMNKENRKHTLENHKRKTCDGTCGQELNTGKPHKRRKLNSMIDLSCTHHSAAQICQNKPKKASRWKLKPKTPKMNPMKLAPGNMLSNFFVKVKNVNFKIPRSFSYIVKKHD